MILFENDYIMMGKDHYDYGTNNLSFVKMYSILKRMGVRNNKFFLMILDTDLIGVDPHNLRDNSMELKLRIAQECKLNPWYVFRSVIRVPAAGTDGIPFRLSRANLAMIWLFFNHVDNLLIMPRQVGKTIGSISISAVITYILGDHITFAMLTKDDTLRKENVERLADIRDGFPEWLVFKQSSDTSNSESISYTNYNNKYITFVGQNSIKGAEKLGRGMTVPSQHWDEIAVFPKIQITYPIAISSTNAAIESAKANHQPYGNILTTTAGMLNTEEGKFTHKLICNSLPFTEKLYDLSDVNELNRIVKENNRQGMVYCEFSYRQLGKTDEWFLDKAAKTAGDQDVIDRDYLNKWTFGTASSPMTKDVLNRLHQGKAEPVYIQYIEDFLIRWYIPEDVVTDKVAFSKIPIAIGMDASENVGKDFTSFVFSDARDMSVLATCACNTTNIIKVAAFIVRWVKLENVVFIPERNSVGVAIIDYCLLQLEELGINPFYRIYNTVIQEGKLDGKTVCKAELSRPGLYDRHRKTFGFRTSSASRPFLYKTVFGRLMETSCHNVKDYMLVNQIAGLTTRNGRIDHGTDGNDDSVIAYVLTGYLLFFGNNLGMYDFAGGNIDNLLCDLEPEKNNKKDSIGKASIEQIKTLIIHLERKLKSTSNDTLKIEILQRIRRLKDQLPPEDENSLSDANSLTQLKPKRLPIPGNTTFDKGNHIFSFLSGL